MERARKRTRPIRGAVFYARAPRTMQHCPLCAALWRAMWLATKDSTPEVVEIILAAEDRIRFGSSRELAAHMVAEHGWRARA